MASSGASERSGGGEAVAARPFPSIWMFIAADCMSFAMFFAVFMSERLHKVAQFDQSARQLDRGLGLVNTLILITSSFMVAMAVSSARREAWNQARRFLKAGLLVGSGFGAIKLFEYAGKVRAGITPLTNDFFSYYFALTGVHFVHYLGGMAVLLYLLHKTGQEGFVPRRMIWLESGGIYWHLVDLLWVFLFPMLYLLPSP